ncbi:alpha/beta hydrolase [Aquimarina addita]|uniref:Alpha/beta hydrolase n=1 Tax=Aquimarina addita TaxID=870485 RepID=A0ABP7XAA7_9FLAO
MTLGYKGIKINYDTEGNGTPLVFLHGFLENSTMWDMITPHFLPTYQCITIDLLGHGKTDCKGYIHNMEDMANAVKAVLDILTDQKITIIGHSMGGYVGLAYLDLFPEMVSGLLLLNSTSLPDSDERKKNRDRAIQIVKKNPDAYTSMAIANLFAAKNRAAFSKEIDAIKIRASKTTLQGIIAALEGMKIRKDRSEVFKNFNGSKAIFAGKEDPVLLYQQRILEAKKYNINLVSFGGGHMTYLENKDQFLRSLQDFLK